MWIFLRKKDAEAFLESRTAFQRLTNDFEALKAQWDTELVRLANLKEMVQNLLNRIEQRARREANRLEEEEPATVPVEEPKPTDERTARIMQRRAHRAVRGNERGLRSPNLPG